MSKEINMNIEVGDYVRTKSGKIRKVKTTVAQYYITDRLNISDNNQFTKEDIVKHSKNIIDLIEVGDIVNGYRIDLIDPWGVLVHEARGINRSGFSIPVAQYEEDIKTVETHEQHEQNRYTVERS